MATKKKASAKKPTKAQVEAAEAKQADAPGEVTEVPTAPGGGTINEGAAGSEIKSVTSPGSPLHPRPVPKGASKDEREAAEALQRPRNRYPSKVITTISLKVGDDVVVALSAQRVEQKLRDGNLITVRDVDDNVIPIDPTNVTTYVESEAK